MAVSPADPRRCARRLQMPYSGFGMATRSIWCIIISRAIRTVAFMLTVLPSQRPGCYGRRFPPVPDTWLEFLTIGFGQLRASGGCNDLIISGAALLFDPGHGFKELEPNHITLSGGPQPASLYRPQHIGTLISAAYKLMLGTMPRATPKSLINDLTDTLLVCEPTGHATIYTVVPLAYGEYYGRWTAALLWYFVFRTSLRVRRSRGCYEDISLLT